MKSNLGIEPNLFISLLNVSSLPIGTSGIGIFGIEDNILSNLFLIKDCSFAKLSNSIEISLDFSNKLLSLDLDISFFSFSKFSFF